MSNSEYDDNERGPLQEETVEALREQLANSTLDIPESFFAGKSYDDLLTEALIEDYERLDLD